MNCDYNNVRDENHLWVSQEAQKDEQFRTRIGADGAFLSVRLNGKRWDFDLCLNCGRIRPVNKEDPS